MGLEERIETDLKKAMKDKDQLKISTLRMLKADIEALFIQKKRSDLKDEDIVKLVRGQVRKHKDSIDQFAKGGRTDLADKEKRELEVLKLYMPEEFPAEELEKIVREAISETGASSKADMGKVMKVVMGKVKGKADGKAVSQAVSSLLK